MNAPPELFDRDLLAKRRARAARSGVAAGFLHAAVAEEISERLREVNRSFRAPALIGPRPDLWRPALAAAGLDSVAAFEDAETLALAPASHDLVVHGLALHWSNDPVGQLVQSRRALAPDGLFIGALFGGETLTELRAALTEAEAELTGGLSPRIAPMGEIRALGALLQRAGFALPVADAARFDVLYGGAFDLMRDLRAMAETNVLRDRLRRPSPRGLFARAAELYAARFGRPDGRVPATFEVIFLTGWAPAPDQPKPLRPGSATTRLADALGVAERSAGAPDGPERDVDDGADGTSSG